MPRSARARTDNAAVPRPRRPQKTKKKTGPEYHILTYVPACGWGNPASVYRIKARPPSVPSEKTRRLCTAACTQRLRSPPPTPMPAGRKTEKSLSSSPPGVPMPPSGKVPFLHSSLCYSPLKTSIAFCIWLSYCISYSSPSGFRYSYSSSMSGSIPTP